MNRIGLLGAAVAFASATANAVMLDPSQRGEVLIVPYYTVNDGQQTLLSVVNHSSAGKAVRVRFRERENGRETLSFNLYLGEYDVWTAALFASDATSEARLLTQDNSCTVPAIKANTTLPQLPGGARYVMFRNFDFSGARGDGGSTAPARTREGYAELIEMGTLVENSPSDVAATHVAGVPTSCASLEAAWAPGGYWTANPGVDLLPPSGQLSAVASVIDVEGGALYSVRAAALSHFSVVVQHTVPGSPLPDLASAVTETARQKVESVVVSEGRIYRSYWPQDRAIDAVSAALTQSSVHNEFNIDPAIGASTRWQVTLPTRRHYTDTAIVGSTPLAPFTVTTASTAQACERISNQAYDREGRRRIGSTSLDPEQAFPCICSAVERWNVVADSTANGVSGCAVDPLVTTPSTTPFNTGFFDLQASGNGHISRPALAGERFNGLPMLGFTVIRYRNVAAKPGELGIYSSAVPHESRVDCVAGEAPCTPL